MEPLLPSQLPPPETLILYPDGSLGALMFHYAAEERDCADIAHENGFDLASISLEHDNPELYETYGFAEVGTGDDGYAAVKAWQPTVPNGWLLAGKWDTEDGPVAHFIRRHAPAPEPGT